MREVKAPPGEGWQAMETAPTTGPVRWVEVWNGRRIVEAHFARDLSGDEQPPFVGWFAHAPWGNAFLQVTPEPTHWRARPASERTPESGDANPHTETSA